MKNNFQDCLQRVLKDEGGYTNDASDSGGPTIYGITIADVRKYVKKNATASDVKALSLDQAKTIYKARYWDAISADTLPSGVDYTCFDYAVNSGLGRPRKALQTFKSLSGTKLVDAINNERTAFLRSIAAGKNGKFLKGWLARVERVRSYSKVLASRTDNVSGPTSALASFMAFFASVYQYIHDHPYLVIGGSVGGSLLLGTLIHLYRNRNKNV